MKKPVIDKEFKKVYHQYRYYFNRLIKNICRVLEENKIPYNIIYSNVHILWQDEEYIIYVRQGRIVLKNKKSGEFKNFRYSNFVNFIYNK